MKHLSRAAGIRLLVVPLVCATLVACDSSLQKEPLFSLLPSDSTGIAFVNEIEDQPGRHLLTYEYFYNGGGVGVGDVNNDGRPDLYFTANMGPNGLYLNQDNLQFENVTDQAGVRDDEGWTTGVTMVDLNGDGLLDIYVCHAGQLGTANRRNKLYVNQGTDENGIPSFDEKAADYGLDDPAFSTHTTFFDYDRDGDLDLYLLNHPPVRDARVNAQPDRRMRSASDKLYRNNASSSNANPPQFTDVTGEVGLKNQTPGYGLSATVSDINQDGWPDVYVANDYAVEDRLYINQGDGTFTDAIHDWLDHMTASSMGADIADYNNDGRPDIFVADMLAESNRRQKLLRVTQTPSYPKDYQYMRNMLHLHNGDLGSSPGQAPTFSEIGQLAGVSNTDWSWAALFADYDLDGSKDLYVTNGFRRDYTNLDFLNGEYLPALQSLNGKSPDLYELVQKIPSTPISNYVFRNQGNLTFEEKSADWGVAQRGFSNGAAYVDLDTDGDLDLVVNNINDPVWIYRNNAHEQTEYHYLRVELEGTGQNRFGIGAKVKLTTPDERTFFQEMMPTRGFQSSVEPVLTFGLGRAEEVDLTVTWPDQTRQRISDVRANQTITLHQEEAQPFEPVSNTSPKTPLSAVSSDQKGLSFTHRENPFQDYRHEPLLPHKLSRLGPALARGDVNSDGRTDVFVGGARGQASALFVQRLNGAFERASLDALQADRAFEDVAATFFDAEGEGDPDLYVVSGGSSEVRAEVYQDRLYLNDGTGTFEAAPSGALPAIESSGGAVAAHDYDGDGDEDLFVGGRVRPNAYPLPPRSHLLENTGGRFEDVTARAAEALRRPGMVTDARWHDLTDDGSAELLLAGEWMGLRAFRHDGEGDFTEITEALGLERSGGWWNGFAIADLDGDGDPDIIAGNRGENAQFHARPDAPASVYAGDFDQDGGVEPIMSHYIDGTEYPLPRRDLLMKELPLLRARFQTYEAYAEATMDEVLLPERREKARRFKAHTFTTSLFEQQADGTVARHDLPVEAQFSPTHDLVVRDANGDGRPDVLLAGNDFTVREPWGPSDAGQGVLLLNEGGLTFEAQRARESGFFAPGDVRSLLLVPTPEAPLVVVGNNDAPLDLFELQFPSKGVATR